MDQIRARKVAGLCKPSVLYPFNKISHALLRFVDLMPSGFTIEGIVNFTSSEQLAVLPGDDLQTGVSVTRRVDVLQPRHQLIMLDDGAQTTAAGSPGKMQELENLLGRAARQGNELILLKPPDPETATLMEKHGLPRKVVSEHAPQHLARTPVEMDDLSATRVIVAGTGPCMGKYTTVLLLQRELRRRQIETASIATEESGFLLSECCLANLPERRRAELVELSLLHLDDHKLILSSGQGGVVDPGPQVWNTPWRITYQMAHFQELRPHAVILQAHIDDPYPKIEAAISLIRIMSRGRTPIALVIPCARETAYQQYRNFTDGEIHLAKQELRDTYGIPVFEVLRDDRDLELLADVVSAELTVG